MTTACAVSKICHNIFTVIIKEYMLVLFMFHVYPPIPWHPLHLCLSATTYDVELQTQLAHKYDNINQTFIF